MPYAKEEDAVIKTEMDITANEALQKMKDNMSKCKYCKFNKENLLLYNVNLPRNIIKNICKYNYEPCCKCVELSKEIQFSEIHKSKLNRVNFFFRVLYDFPVYDNLKKFLLTRLSRKRYDILYQIFYWDFIDNDDESTKQTCRINNISFEAVTRDLNKILKYMKRKHFEKYDIKLDYYPATLLVKI